jgi:hypothetical protein
VFVCNFRQHASGPKRILSVGVPVSAWACAKSIAKGRAKTTGFRKAPAECNCRDALVRQTGIGEVASAARETPLANVLTDRVARTLLEDLLKMATGESDSLSDLFDRQERISQRLRYIGTCPREIGCGCVTAKPSGVAFEKGARSQCKVIERAICRGRQKHRVDSGDEAFDKNDILPGNRSQRVGASEGQARHVAILWNHVMKPRLTSVENRSEFGRFHTVVVR